VIVTGLIGGDENPLSKASGMVLAFNEVLTAGLLGKIPHGFLRAAMQAGNVST
jgi:hypothetical protein